MKIDVKHLIPLQEIGHQCDNIAYKVCTEENYFNIVKDRLEQINFWHLFAGKEKAKFIHVDNMNKQIMSMPKEDDFIKIKIPGAHNLIKRSYDWVQIIAIVNDHSNNIRYYKMMLQPSFDPCSKKSTTQHFLQQSATNTIILVFDGIHLQLSIHGRNECINNETSPLSLVSIRNAIVAQTGFVGLSSLQWQSLANGLLKDLNHVKK